MNLGVAMLAALGVVAGLLAWMFPKPSRTTRVSLGSACLVLLLLAVILSIRGEGKKGTENPSQPSSTGAKTIEKAGHDWPALPTAWTASPVDTIEDGPIVAGNYLVMSTSHRRIQVLNGNNGTSAWPPYVTREDNVSLNVVDDRIVFIDEDTISALSIANGKRLWSRNIKNLSTSSGFVVARDLLLIKDGPRLRALNVASGKVRWTWDSKQDDLKEVLRINQSVYVADDAGRLYGLDIKGRLQWTYAIPHGDPVELALGGGEAAQPMAAVGNALLFPAGPGGNVYAISTDTRRELWRQSFGEVQAIKPGDGQALVITSDRLVAVDAPSGKQLWSHAITGTTVTAKRVYGVIARQDKVDLVAIDLDGGNEVWRTSLDDYNLSVYPIRSGAFIYFSDPYILYMLDPVTGEPRGIYKPQDLIGSVGTSVMEAEVGNLTVVNDGGRLVALRRGQ
jgi:outer membrane protein assembly factor BamB